MEQAPQRMFKGCFKLPSAFVRTLLGAHSVIGLTAAALLYLVCVSGVFSVFYTEYERWEQPQAPETVQVDPHTLQRAVEAELAQEAKRPDHVYVSLPTDDMPRVTVTAGETGRFMQDDGALGEEVAHDWTHFIVALHYALNLPTFFGMTLVGLIGIMLTAMVVSGLLSHPNIFKDAFSFRMGGAKRLQQVDLHNRLSVWTAPFQLMIALTGAFIGLSQLFLLVTATLFYDGKTEAVSHVFYPEGAPTGIAAPMADVGAALRNFMHAHPELKPFAITVHEPATTAQVVEVSALVPRRLAWAEFYRYDAAGNALGPVGWAEGSAGVQVYASTYRLHFGHFAGLPVKFAYVLLGIVLCVVIASGVNIWLLRRMQNGRPAPLAERLWIATLWGVPLAIAASAWGELALEWNPTAIFWGLLCALLIGGVVVKDRRALSRCLRAAVAGAGLVILLTYAGKFGWASFGSAALLVNTLWFALAAAMLVSL